MSMSSTEHEPRGLGRVAPIKAYRAVVRAKPQTPARGLSHCADAIGATASPHFSTLPGAATQASSTAPIAPLASHTAPKVRPRGWMRGLPRRQFGPEVGFPITAPTDLAARDCKSESSARRRSWHRFSSRNETRRLRAVLALRPSRLEFDRRRIACQAPRATPAHRSESYAAHSRSHRPVSVTPAPPATRRLASASPRVGPKPTIATACPRSAAARTKR